MRPFFGIRTKYPALEEIEYITCLGAVFTELTVTHIERINQMPWGGLQKARLDKYVLARNREKPVIVILEILPNTPMSTINSLKAGDTIQNINDIQVSTMSELIEQVSRIYKNKTRKLLIETHYQDFFSFPLTSEAVKLDAEISSKHGIPKSQSLFSKLNKYGIVLP